MGRAAIFTDNNYSSEVKAFKVLEIKMHAPTRLIGAPIENGRVIFDNKVIDPIVISIVGVIEALNPEASNSVQQIMKMRNERQFKLLSVSDGFLNINNLVMETFSSSRSPDKVDLVYYTITYREQLSIEGDIESKKIQSSDYSDTVNGGFQQGT